MKYIYHHLGLGDHIICNGLIRSIVNSKEKYSLFVKQHNKKSVEFMYRDLPNIEFIIGDDNFVQNFIVENNLNSNDLIIAGFYNHPNSFDFAESFYMQNNIPPINRWSKFYVKRDKKKEKDLFDFYNLTENNYVFIHDDKSRMYEIDEDLIENKHLQIVRPIKGITDNIFDYCYLMEKSFESHFIDSSFRLIFDCMSLRNSNLFYHIKMKNSVFRNQNKYYDARTNKLNFKIIE